jgi:hypothetical protein
VPDHVEEKPKRVTKKKQFPVVAVITPDGIEGNLLQGVRRPLIVHLPIQSKDVLIHDMPIAYDPMPPMDAEPYDSSADNPFCEEIGQMEHTSMSSISNSSGTENTHHSHDTQEPHAVERSDARETTEAIDY